MLMELFATFAIGIAVAGTIMAVRRLVLPGLPRFLTPSLAGLAMIGFSVWSEYTWFDRTEAALPDGITVISTFENSSAYRPWTRAVPYIDRFAAVDIANLRRNDKVPGQVMVDVIVMARQAANAKLPVLVDCPGSRRADISDGMTFDDDGALVNAAWTSLPKDDALLGAVCATP